MTLFYICVVYPWKANYMLILFLLFYLSMIFNSSGGMFEKNLIMGICLYNDILIISHSLMCIQTICVIYIIIYIYIYIISTYFF